MDAFQAVVLGAIQGLTEFIPVSSSGHLVLAEYVLEGAGDHYFLEFINIGTLIALLVYFWPKIVQILKDIFVHKKYSLARNIIVTSIPAGIIGYTLSSLISSSSFFTNALVVAITLAVVGAVMVVLERIPRASNVTAGGEGLSWQRALVIGIAQTFALIPGVSRSGATIISGRLAGLTPADAAEYSFLASIPIMLGVTLKLFVSHSDRLYYASHWQMLLIANAVAFITGMIAIRFLLRYLAHHDLRVFGWYRLGMAAIVLGVILLQLK